MNFQQQWKLKSLQLKEDLKQWEKYFDNFTEESVKAMEQRKKEFKLSQQQNEKIIEQLLQNEKNLKEQNIKYQEEFKLKVEEEKNIKEKLEKLRIKERTLPDTIQQLKQSLQYANDQLLINKKVLIESEKCKKMMIQELTKGNFFYKDRLGFEFQRIGVNRLRFLFTQIDPKNPERVFYFSIFINSKEEYQIEECFPLISESKLSPLLKELNKTNQLSFFIQQIRKKFQESLEEIL